MNDGEVLQLEDVWVKYGDNVVLEGITFTLYEGDFLGIIGPNGGGKTTLLKAILGLAAPSRGTVKVFGDAPENSRRHIGYVAQKIEFDQDFPLSLLDVVLMGRCSSKGLLRRYDESDVVSAEEALKKVGMYECRDAQVGALSGGEQKRVFIARALVSMPRLLMLDEPSASIDAAYLEEFYDLLKRLNESVTIVMVSHDIGAISTHVKQIACLNHKLYYHGSKEDINPEDIERTYSCPVDLIAHGVPHRVLREH